MEIIIDNSFIIVLNGVIPTLLTMLLYFHIMYCMLHSVSVIVFFCVLGVKHHNFQPGQHALIVCRLCLYEGHC